jgi:hypothetical protein
MTARIRLLLGLLVLSVAVGCTGSKNQSASLTGTITYKGEKLTAGKLLFHKSTEDVGTEGGINPDGTYSAFGLPVGEVILTINTEQFNPATKQQYGGGRGGDKVFSPAPKGQPENTGKYVKIPEKYTDIKQSPLKITLKPGKQSKDWELTD